MSIGDVKPASLRALESIIWKNLYLVACCRLSAEDMLKRVLDSVVDPLILASFRQDKHRLHRHFREHFNAIDDYTGFFFPGEYHGC